MPNVDGSLTPEEQQTIQLGASGGLPMKAPPVIVPRVDSDVLHLDAGGTGQDQSTMRQPLPPEQYTIPGAPSAPAQAAAGMPPVPQGAPEAPTQAAPPAPLPPETVTTSEHSTEAKVMTPEAKANQADLAKVESDSEKLGHKGTPEESDALEAERKRKRTAMRARLMVDDVTPETMIDYFEANPHGFLQFREELSAMFAMFKREGREMERTVVLQAWNGNNAISIDRRSVENASADQACLSMFGGLQPGVLLDQIDQIARSASLDDGLLQRFQMAVWPGILPYKHVDRDYTEGALEAATECLQRLRNLPPPGVRIKEGANGQFYQATNVCTFDAEAKEAFLAWFEPHMNEIRFQKDHEVIVAHRDKARKTIVQIAMILHLVDGNTPEQPIALETLEKAWAWGEFLAVHSQRIYAGLLKPLEMAVQEIAKYISNGSLKEPFSCRDLVRKKWRFVSESIVEEAVACLGRHGWLRDDDEDKNGQPAFQANPICWGDIDRARAMAAAKKQVVETARRSLQDQLMGIIESEWAKNGGVCWLSDADLGMACVEFRTEKQVANTLKCLRRDRKSIDYWSSTSTNMDRFANLDRSKWRTNVIVPPTAT